MSEAVPEGTLGYVAQVSDAHAYVGGLFVVGPEGDPLDFAYTEPVLVSPLQRFLLGGRIDAYMLARVLLPALVPQASVRPSVILVDEPSFLLRRPETDIPLVVLAAPGAAIKDGAWSTLDVAGAPEGLAFWTRDGLAGAHRHLERAVAEMAPFSIAEPFEQARRTLAEMRRGRGR